MTLQLQIGHFTATGPRERNEDFCGYVMPDEAQLFDKGFLAALADGVSGGKGGREAAEYTVRGLLSDYYATPATWSVSQSLDKVIQSINRWLIAQAARRRDLAGMSSTLSAVVIRGRHIFAAHIGDSRIYRIRNQTQTQMTRDHVWDRPDMNHVLKRAMGLDHHLMIDFHEDELQSGDIFVLVSDGVWEPLGDVSLYTVATTYDNPNLAAEEMVRQALKKGGSDNATALLIRVLDIGATNLSDHIHSSELLPVPQVLKPGMVLDDFEILERLHESRITLLYKVRRVLDGRLFVLKTLTTAVANHREFSAALIHEEWLARKITSHYFSQVLPLSSEQRSALYYVMSWHAGATLQKRLDVGQYFSVPETIQIAIRLIKGLAVLHRLNIVHGDIKPDNLHLDEDGKLRILDLGVANSIGFSKPQGAGTPSFMAPELFMGNSSTQQSDIYAVGVTVYHLLTRRYPHGEIEPFQHPRFGDPIPPTRYRPETPSWLENVLLTSLHSSKDGRFKNVDDFLKALELGEWQSQLPSYSQEKQRNIPSTQLWIVVTLLSLVANVFFIYILLVSRT